jgi:hypothetical protein
MKSIFSPKVFFLATIVTTAIAHPSLAQNLSASPAVGSPAVGFEFEGSRNLNVGSLIETEYVGDCPGREMSTQVARFISESLAPGENQRVVIKNVTRGLGEMPYTDREYDKGRLSEGTVVKFGTSHDSKFFTVLPGENLFQYEVRRRDQSISTGTFTAMINQDRRQVERNARWMTDEVCGNSSVSKDYCADMRSRQQLKCPSGNVLQTRWDGDYDRGVRTTFRNRTNKTVHFTMDGDQYVVQPGDRVNVRRSRDFRVGFNPSCHNCTPSTDRRVTYGTRMQFRVTNGQVTLTDDRRD